MTLIEKRLSKVQNGKRLILTYSEGDSVKKVEGVVEENDGEAALAMDENEHLKYIVPDEGSNLWIDSWFVPKSCRNYQDALTFLDFLCDNEVALQNFEYVYYASPILYVQTHMDIDDRLNSAINPENRVTRNCEVYRALDNDTSAYLNTLWQELKSQ